MNEERIHELVEAAIDREFDGWAAEHPSLAAVIDRIVLTRRAVESIRDSDAYRDAIAAYHRHRNEMDLLNRLTDLARPILTGLLGL